MFVRVSDDSPIMVSLKEEFYKNVSIDSFYDRRLNRYWYVVDFSGHYVGRSGYFYRREYLSLFGCKGSFIDRDKVLTNDLLFMEFVEDFFGFIFNHDLEFFWNSIRLSE